MAEFDPLGQQFTDSHVHASVPNSSGSTTMTVPGGGDIMQLLDRIQCLEAHVQNQSTLMSQLKKQTTNYGLIEERLAEMGRRIDRIEAVTGSRATRKHSSYRAPPPLTSTSTRLPTIMTVRQCRQQLYPSTSGHAIPPRVPRLAQTTGTPNSRKKQNERTDIVDWGQRNVKLELEGLEPYEVQSLLSATRTQIIDTQINPLQCKFCPPSSNPIFQDAESLANHYTSCHLIPGVGEDLPSSTDQPENAGRTYLPQERVPPRSLDGVKSSMKGRRSSSGGTCPKCGKYVRDIYAHRKTHKPPSERPRFTCTSCEADFMSKSSLQNHCRTRHTNEPIQRPLPTFPCPICGKLFRQNFGLKAHMTAHTGERPFSCKYCDKTFSRQAALRTHLFIHTGKPYACDQCGLQFTNRSIFASHKLRCHEKNTRARSPGGSQSPPDHFPGIQIFPKIEIIETTFDNTENND